ncbi:MAG: zinc-ribbon domain-containing protein, partial [Epulopiscium sp.]|nr:zinc-ribbon domain-containing protein [Candidatus Epulonipiscium sp.]
MKCNNCNKDIEAGSKFCTNCGELVPVETNKPLAEATPTTETNPIENKQDKPSFNGKLLIPVAIIAV